LSAGYRPGTSDTLATLLCSTGSGEKVTRADKNLEEITKLTLQGQVDEILSKKEQLGELRDIFHYQNKPCPRLILIMGGPGEYYKVLVVVM